MHIVRDIVPVSCARSAHSYPVMVSRNISPRQAYVILEAGTSEALLTTPSFQCFHAALPLYNPTSVFYRHLELFSACNCRPTVDHPIILAWLAEQSGGPPLKPPTKIQSIPKTSGITTHPPSLTVNTSTLSNGVPSTSIDTFDMASLNEALSRYQPASAAVS